MTDWWKAHPASHRPWKSLRDSHIPDRSTAIADGKVENQKAGFPLSHRTVLSLKRLKQNTTSASSLADADYRLPTVGKNSCPRMEKYLTPITWSLFGGSDDSLDFDPPAIFICGRQASEFRTNWKPASRLS